MLPRRGRLCKREGEESYRRGEAAHGQVAECGLREFRASGSYYVKEGSTFRERQSQPEGKTFTLWLPFFIS